jgi:hypothetical protein
MTTQIVFEQAPLLTLHADEQHFKIRTNTEAPRSIAIIPNIEAATVSRLFPDPNSPGISLVPTHKELVTALDRHLRTNLFVFFQRSNQLMFELGFSEKKKADYIVIVKQDFNKDCRL